MRGEFIRGDGLVIPNNITRAGSRLILDLAVRRDSPYQNEDLIMSLTNAVFSPTMQLNVDAVALQDAVLYRTVAGWPTLGLLNGQSFVESAPVEFPPVIATVSATRLMICDTNEQILCLSGPFPTPLLVTPTTPAADRTFRYRLYLG